MLTGVRYSLAEIIISRLFAPTTGDTMRGAIESCASRRISEEFAESFSASVRQTCIVISATFHEYAKLGMFDFFRLHHRFPPMCPVCLICPKVYFFSQIPMRSASSLCMLDVSPSFSKVTTFSGSLLNSSTNRSAWVVTINWVKADALAQQFGEFRQRIGVQSQFRFFDANERRRRWVAAIASRHRKRNVPSETGCRNGNPAFHAKILAFARLSIFTPKSVGRRI